MIVDVDPHPKVQVRRLREDGRYGAPVALTERETLEVTDPFAVSFDLTVLSDFS